MAIRDLETIVENVASGLSDTATPAKDLDTLVGNVRIALKRTITRMYAEDGSLRVYTLDADLERAMAASLTRGEGGSYLALSADVLQSIVKQVAEAVQKFRSLSQTPVILTSQVMRVHFYHLIGQFYPNVRVLSFNEIANNVQIQSLGSLRLEHDEEKS